MVKGTPVGAKYYVLSKIFPHSFFTFSALFMCLFNYTSICFINVEAKVHPRKDFEGPEGEWKYSAILSLTSALDGGGQRHSLAENAPVPIV